MANFTLLSPGVQTREIDLSGPVAATITGIPAGVIGTAVRGPAFVPVTVGSFADFVSKFGNSDGQKFAPMAMREWLLNGGTAGTFTRVLGVGDGKQRNADGTVTNAGYVVGGQLPKGNGFLGHNASAGRITLADSDQANPTKANTDNINAAVQYRIFRASGPEGRLYTLGCFMQEASGSSFFTEAGLAKGHGAALVDPADGKLTEPRGIVRGIIMAASGVVLSLSSSVRSHRNTRLFGTAKVTENAKTGFIANTYSAHQNKKPAAHGGDKVTATSGTLGYGKRVGQNIGLAVGDVNIGANGNQAFTLYLNGLKDQTKRIRELSFDPNNGSYFALALNKDPEKLQEEGHVLYSHFDVYPHHAVPADSIDSKIKRNQASKRSVAEVGGKHRPGAGVAFVLTGSAQRNSGTLGSAVSLPAAVSEPHLTGTVGHVGVPNFENWEDRFTTAATPFIISQAFGGKRKSLFRLIALDDGAVGAGNIKVTIENINYPKRPDINPYGTFDVILRKIDDTDREPIPLTGGQFRGLTLDPSAANYIEKVIGSQHVFFDFDQKSGGQKLVTIPGYPVTNPFVRVEMSSYMKGEPDKLAIPMGFRGIGHLVTSGSSRGAYHATKAKNGGAASSAVGGGKGLIFSPGPAGTLPHRINANTSGPGNQQAVEAFKRITMPPIPMRQHCENESGNHDSALTWGIQFEHKVSLNKPNLSPKFDSTIFGYLKHYPKHMKNAQSMFVENQPGAASQGGSILDTDKFNNNVFTLERIEVLTQSDGADGTIPDVSNWGKAQYRRDGRLKGSAQNIAQQTHATRFLKPSDLSDSTTSNSTAFTLPFVGGFDGVNIFDKEKAALSTVAVRREMDDTNQGRSAGPTVASLRKAIDIMEEKADVDIQLLTIPGMRHEAITDYAMSSVERRFDALYLMDVENKDSLNSFVTASAIQQGLPGISVQNTVNRFAARALNSSFAAAYFPDVRIIDRKTALDNDASPVICPPTVAALGVMALNDTSPTGFPWTAPAGKNRGVLTNATDSTVELDRRARDILYDARINFIAPLTSTGPIMGGQKTLEANVSSALNRINVRRLLIDVRRKVKRVAQSLLFEPNREDTLVRFNNRVNPILTDIQAQQGLESFLVRVDTSTTSQADVENNTIRGKIFLQPVRSIEFISLDFVVTNAGDDG